ncbi:acyl carrier protein [Roseateles sp. DXS20W]|uniref:Acyl carrier protein n=1 Tax=Pelomonas lactea TaxID=3299030 RepID=A0ABW7GS22_9BURK
MTQIQTDVEQRLLRTAQRSLNLDTQALDAASPLSDLGDSLDFVDLIGDVEAEFGIDFSNEALGVMRTVGDLLRGIEAELRTRSAAPVFAES